MEKICGAIISYLAIVAIIFWPILLPPQGQLVFGDDIHRSYHFFRQLFSEAIQQGEFPSWNPYLFSGEPLIANPSVAFWYPINWLFAVFPYRYVFSWSIAFHIFWAMVGMYCALRAMSNVKCQMSNVGALVGGLVFGLSGYFMGRVWEGHIELIAAASWMPWVVYTNIKCQMSNVKWKTNCVIAGLVFALQLLAGYQSMALFTLEALFIVTLSLCHFIKSYKPLLRMGIGLLIGLGLAAIQIIPAQEFFGRSIRTYELPYSWAVFGSYTKENLKQLWNPFLLGFPWKYQGPSPNFGEMAAYMGKATLVLSAIGFVWAIRRRAWMGLAMAAVAAFGLWVSFGWNASVDLNKLLWDIIPTYKYLRIPSRHLILFVFGLSALAGIGVSLARHSLARLVIPIVLVVDMMWFVQNLVVLKPDPAVRHNKELVAYLQKNSGLTRVLPNFNVGMGTRDALDFDAAMSYRLFSASGYDPAILRNYYEFAAAVASVEKPDVQTSDVQIPYLLPGSRYVDFLNVKHIFVPSWFDSVAGSSSKYKRVMEENVRDYFYLYENTKVLPRFFLVPTIVGLSNRDAIARAIREGEYDPGSVVLVAASDVPAGHASDCRGQVLPEVSVTSYTMNAVVLKTSSPCNVFLATSEVMYPGWTATIDGTPARLIEGNLAFRTLPVPSGSHTIVLWYEPRIFLIGTVITLATAALCFFWTRRRRTYYSI